MNISSPSTLTKQSLSKSIDGTCLVLQYHRVGQFCYDPQNWAVDPYKFENQMQYLATNCHVISLDQMKNHILSNTPFEPRTIVVTFDGGYSDVLYTALQIFENYKIPATVFSASAYIMKQGQFWWDTLEDYFIANCFHGQLEIDFDNFVLKWPLENQMDRFKAYYDLYSVLIDKTPDQQQDLLGQIALSIKMQIEEFDNHRTMNAQELKELDQSDLITIGGYTHHGVKLSSLNKFQQTDQIMKNKYVLEEVTGHEVRYFSYPFDDNCNHVITGTARILRDNGFCLACGNSYETINVAKPIALHDIPRIKVGNWNPIAFHTFLDRIFD